MITVLFRIISSALLLSFGISQNPRSVDSANAHRVETEIPLDKPRPLKAMDLNLAEALKQVADTFQLSMLVELSETLPAVKLSAGTPTAREVLNEIVKKNPEYSWQLYGSSVHFHNRKLVREPANFLNLVLKSFTISGTVASVDLRLRSEIGKAQAGINKPGGLIVGIRPAELDRERLPTVVLHDASVREVMFKLEALEPRLYTAVVFPRPGMLRQDDIETALGNWQWLSLELPSVH